MAGDKIPDELLVRPVHSADPVSRNPEHTVIAHETDLLDASIPPPRRDGDSDEGEGPRDDDDLESHHTSVVFYIDKELVKPE